MTVKFVHFVKSWVIEAEQGCLLLWRQEFEPLEDFSDLKIFNIEYIYKTRLFTLSIQLENKQPFPHPLSRVAAHPAG